MMRALARAALIALAGLSLASCIDSSDPILLDSQPVFGKTLRLSYFTLRDGSAHDPREVTYTWNGALYAHASGGLRDVAAFSVHPFEAGDYIIQGVPARQTGATEYALLHKLAGGVYQVIPIDAADADEPTRDADCKRGADSSCRVVTREQLFDFARATAARGKDDGALVIRMPDTAVKRQRRLRRR
jgi:hypothetical protein